MAEAVADEVVEVEERNTMDLVNGAIILESGDEESVATDEGSALGLGGGASCVGGACGVERGLGSSGGLGSEGLEASHKRPFGGESEKVGEVHGVSETPDSSRRDGKARGAPAVSSGGAGCSLAHGASVHHALPSHPKTSPRLHGKTKAAIGLS